MKKDKHNIFHITLKLGIIILFIVTAFSSINSGVYVDTSVEFEIDTQLETYSFAEGMDFSQIIINSTYIVFNTTGFNVTCASAIGIQIDDIVDDVLLPSAVDEELVSFTTTNFPGITWFNISGFSPGLYYNVSKSGVYYDTYQANGSGSISIYDATPGANPYIISANGSVYSPVVTTTGDATNVTNSNAIINALLDYDGGETCSVWFEYGATTSYGNTSLNFGFTLLDTQDDGGIYQDIWSNDTYVYTACDASGVRVYTFDGATFTLLDTQDDGNNYYDVWGSDTYVYTACGTSGVRAYTFNGTTFTLLDAKDNGGTYFDVWGNDTYVYTACGTTNLYAYTFNGVSFTLKDNSYTGTAFYGVWSDNSYVYAAASTAGVMAYTFDGSDLDFVNAKDHGGVYWDVWGDGTYVYTACGTSGIRAYTFDGASFTLLDTQDDGGNYYDVWGDGTYVYAASDTSGVHAYYFNGTSFSLLDTQDDGDNYVGVHGDGTYVYTACDTSGVRAYNITELLLKNTGETFYTILSNLTAGQLYHYRAVANNTNETAYGVDNAFLTLPNVTSSGSAKRTSNFTRINISFTPGDGANFTIIERNTTAGNWDRGEATEIYNGTGTYFVDTDLIRNTTYYYRLWSVANWTYNPTVWQYSSGSGFYLFNTTSSVDPPYNGSSTYFSSINSINITWSRGNFSDREIVVKNNDTWATNPGDGWVRQNSTNQWFNVSETADGYYTIWSYNSTDSIYSLTGLNIPWGALRIQCYDENNHTALNFDVLITNETLETLYLQNVTNPYYVDLNDIPFGDDTIFYVSSDGYESRTYYFDIMVNNFYNLTFYLPFAVPSGGVTDPDYDPDNESYSTLYLISVINEYDGSVEDVKIRILRYINTTDTYENVTILRSDANGQADVYLFAGTLYKVNLSKDGYVSRTEDWIPSDSIFFKTFRLLWENVPFEFDVFGDLINFYGTLYVNNTMMVSYYDLDDATTGTHFTVYEDYNGTLTYMGEYNGTTSNDITFWVGVTNATRLHIVVLDMNHTTLGEVIDYTIVVYPVHVADRDSGNWLENLIISIVGEFAYGYVITFLWYLPCAFIIIGLAAIKHPGVGILGAGFYSTWLTWYLYVPEEAKILTFASIAFAMGAITLFLVKGKGVIHK